MPRVHQHSIQSIEEAPRQMVAVDITVFADDDGVDTVRHATAFILSYDDVIAVSFLASEEVPVAEQGIRSHGAREHGKSGAHGRVC